MFSPGSRQGVAGRVGFWPLHFNLLGGVGVSRLVSESPGGGSGIRWSSLALGGVIAGVLIVATVITVLSFVGGDKLSLLLSAATVHPHESTAEWVGDDATAYASLNLRPGLSNLLKARDFFENIVDFEQADSDFDDGIDEISEMLGIDVRDGVLPVLGPELAMAAYFGDDIFSDEPDFIFFAGFLDMAVGRSIVDAYLARAENQGDRFETLTVGGHETLYVNDEVYITVHDTKPYVLVSSSRDVLERTLSMMIEPVSPLSDHPDFIAAMERLPDARFISGYVNASGLTDAGTGFENSSLGPTPLTLSPIGLLTLEDDFGGSPSEPQIFAGGVTVGKKDLRVDFVGKIGSGEFSAVAPPSNSFDLIPGDVIGFFSMGGLRQTIDQLLEFYDDPELGEELDSGFNDATGLDLRTDLLDPIGDELALVLIDLDSNGLTGMEAFEQVPNIAAALMIEVRDRDRAGATMDRMRELAAESGMDFAPIDILGEQAWIAQVPDESFPLELAYMFVDGFFVGGISVDSLEQVKRTTDGDIDSVKDNKAYKRVLETVGDDPIFVMFVDSEALSRAVRTFIGPDDLPEFDERFAPWFEKIEAFGITAHVDEDWSISTMLLTIN